MDFSLTSTESKSIYNNCEGYEIPFVHLSNLGASFSYFDIFSHSMSISALNFSLLLHILRLNFPLPTLASIQS